MPRLENNVEKLEARNTDVNKVLYWHHILAPYGASNPVGDVYYL